MAGEVRKRRPDSKLKKTLKKDGKSTKVQKTAIAIKISCTMLLFFLSNKYLLHRAAKKNVIASFSEHSNFFQPLECSSEYSKQPQVPNCTPKKCGRLVLDGVLSDSEINILQNVAHNGTMIVGGGSGPASILEFGSSTVSYGEQFISLFARLKNNDESNKAVKEIYSDENLATYKSAKRKIRKAIAENFGIDEEKLYLGSPTFFSRMTNAQPRTLHDEYWHTHIDTNQYPSFHYTTLIYLANYGQDFDGGRFIFDAATKDHGTLEKEQIIEPKAGRMHCFTSGSENPHHVEKIISGTRYALTMGFTCNKAEAKPDPHLPF